MTKNFPDHELACQCGCGMLPDKHFMVLIQAIRYEAGFPMPVSSAARCPDHNERVSKTGRTGPHTTGHAIDIRVSGAQAARIISLGLKYGMQGIGVSQKGPHESRFIHLDDLSNAPGQPRPTVWSY